MAKAFIFATECILLSLTFSHLVFCSFIFCSFLFCSFQCNLPQQNISKIEIKTLHPLIFRVDAFILFNFVLRICHFFHTQHVLHTVNMFDAELRRKKNLTCHCSDIIDGVWNDTADQNENRILQHNCMYQWIGDWFGIYQIRIECCNKSKENVIVHIV